MVEISIVGFLIGTLIAFMVVIGDLGPEILSEIFSVENNSSLRTIIMTGRFMSAINTYRLFY